MKPDQEDALLYAALSQIKTPACDIEPAVRQALSPRSARRRLPRAALLAAALAALLAVGAAAAGFGGLWRRFFPNPAPPGTIATMGMSQTAGDYTLTLEDIMADDDGVIFLLALSRADGKPIDPESRLSGNTVSAGLSLEGEPFPGTTGFFQPPVLSEDGKTLYFCMESRGDGDSANLADRTLTLKASGVAVPLSPAEAFPGRDLSAGFSQPLPLSAEFPSFRFVSVEMTDRGPAITVSQGRDMSGDYVCVRAVPALLTDSRNGTQYGAAESEVLTLPDGTPASRTFYRNGADLTAADLPYLRLTYGYAIDKVLSSAPLALSFPADSGSAQTVPLDRSITLGGTTLHFTELRYSALGLSLRLENPVEDTYVLYHGDAAPVIRLKDGTAVSTHAQGGSGRGNTASVSFRPLDEHGERLFLDPTQIASITLDGATLWSAP